MQSGKKITLAMDTSASPLLLCAEKDGKIFSVRRKGVKQEKLLFPALQALLAKAGAELQDIGRIFIIRGPGRFTGIRISLTFASMLKYLNQTDVRGATMFDVLKSQTVSSRSFLRWQKAHPQGVLGVVLHAFREEYFLQLFDAENKGPQWLSREELLGRLSAYPAPLFLAGTDKDFAPLSQLVGNRYALADEKDCRVRPAELIKMSGEDCWAQNALEPLYLKPARFELIKPA